METLSPIFIVALIGYLVGKAVDLEPKTLALSSIYVFTPALVFKSLSTAEIQVTDLFGVIVIMATVFFSLWVVTLSLVRLIKVDNAYKSAYLLSSIFPNAGNYGLPVVLFAFGKRGFELGVICQLFGALILNSFGVYIASRGDADSFKQAIKNLLFMPALYAFVLALGFFLLRIRPPELLLRPISILGDASIPTELLLLGLQLSRIDSIISSYKLVLSAISIKLILSPVLAFLLAGAIFGFPLGLTGKVLVVVAGTPTAVISNSLALKFNANPELVSSATLLTTVVSLLSMNLIITLLA